MEIVNSFEKNIYLKREKIVLVIRPKIFDPYMFGVDRYLLDQPWLVILHKKYYEALSDFYSFFIN